MARKPVVTA